MPWLSGHIRGHPDIKRELGTTDEVQAALARMLVRYRENGAQVREVLAGPSGVIRVWEIVQGREMIARHWISEEENSDEPL